MPRQRPATGKGNSHANSRSPPHAPGGKANLLTIPLELRQEVYNYLVHSSGSALVNLTTTSRRFSKEVKPFLYKRPPLFDGQYQLFNWIEDIDHDYLPYVTELSIKLVDIDPETIIGALGERLREARANREPLRTGDQDNPYYKACYQDLKRMQKIFSLLPGLRKLTILEAGHGDPQPPLPMIESFSKMLGQCLPTLHTLVSEQPLFPIHFIANKPRLRRLRFPANSQSSEDEVGAVCRKLMPNLQLEVYRQDPYGSSYDYRWGCMTELLSTLPPIKGLSLIEDLSGQPADLLNEAFVESIDTMKRHKNSLRKLMLIAEPPDDARKAALMKRNLLRFIEISSLQHVEVLGIYSSVYRHLPSSTEKFVLRLDRWCCEPDVSLSEFLEEFMDHVKHRALNKDPTIPKLSNLRSIELWLHEHDSIFSPDDEDEDDAWTLEAEVKAQLARIGVHFRLVITDPDNDIYDD